MCNTSNSDTRLSARLGFDPLKVTFEVKANLYKLYLNKRLLLEFDDTFEPIQLTQHILTAFNTVIITYYGDVEELWDPEDPEDWEV